MGSPLDAVRRGRDAPPPSPLALATGCADAPQKSFTPAAGSSQAVGLSLTRTPPGRSLSSGARAKTIVPGATVNVPLAELLGSLPRGRYTVMVGLSQGGHGIGTVTRTIELR